MKVWQKSLWRLRVLIFDVTSFVCAYTYLSNTFLRSSPKELIAAIKDISEEEAKVCGTFLLRLSNAKHYFNILAPNHKTLNLFWCQRTKHYFLIIKILYILAPMFWFHCQGMIYAWCMLKQWFIIVTCQNFNHTFHQNTWILIFES